ncbi:MAG: HAMP domain-containing sensor histidine kinase [Bacteriovorax sp.]|jgi:signal transduction histidine kinase
MSHNTIPFKTFIAKRLKSLNVKFLALSILLIFMAIFYQSLSSNIESNVQSIAGISSYLDNLNSTNDRAELQKILRSVSDSHGTQIKLVKDDHVFSSSEGLGELDQSFKKQSGLKFTNNIFGLDGFSIKIRKLNDGEIYIFSAWTPIIKNILSSFMFLSIAISVLLMAYFRKLKLLLDKSISPLSDLQQDINGLLVGKKLDTRPQVILELEDIRLALLNTSLELENSKEFLATEKAKKLNAEAYKKLIHDLHNPVSALRDSIRIVNDPEFDNEAKTEAVKLIPVIADQLLSQVKSAKKNLEFESANFQKRDVGECLEQCLFLIKANNKENKTIVSHIADEKLVIPHDPILLQRALLNLMENGLEFSKEKIVITAKKYSHYLSIEISDDGRGMNQEDIPVYFQGRGKSSKADRQAFGLSSTNHIARIHGGKLIYTKNEYGGASFELRLNL